MFSRLALAYLRKVNSMKRHNLKKVSILDIHSDHSVNFREEESYKVSALMENIAMVGRINEPLHVELETGIILRGNLRYTAATELLKDPNISAALKSNLEKLDVIYVEGLTPQERMEYILDHGSITPLTRVEIVKTTWKFQAENCNDERKLQTLMYQMYAHYTNNPQKAYEAQSYSPGPARDKFLHDWLHGTLGQWVMAAGLLGNVVREQFILMDRAKDRKLTDEEKARVLFTPNRTRVKELAKAKKEDEKGLGWTTFNGGEKFNALIQQYIAEERGEGKPKETKPSYTQMNATADTMQSPLSLVYKHCAGTLDPKDRPEISKLDIAIVRMEEMKKDVREMIDRIKIDNTFTGAEVREVFRFMLEGHASEFKKYIERFCS